MFLLVAFAVITITPLPGQDAPVQPYADYTENFSLSPPESTISDEPLPAKVLEAQKNKIRIVGQFFIPGHPFAPNNVYGTGFVVNYKSKKVILTARHVLISPIIEHGIGFKLNDGGIPETQFYQYRYFGVISNDGIVSTVYLRPVAMGELGKQEDYIAFSPESSVKIGSVSLVNRNANINDVVYATGFSPSISQIPTRRGGYQSIQADIVDFTFKSKIVAKIDHLAINNAGLKLQYRIRGNLEAGFSGGPVLNTNGEVIGMSIEMLRNFYYAISSDDLTNFLERIYNRF